MSWSVSTVRPVPILVNFVYPQFGLVLVIEGNVAPHLRRSGFVPSKVHRSLAPFRTRSATRVTWQSVCSRTRPYGGEEHSCCQSKTRTAARRSATWRANARLSGLDRSGSAGHARHVHGVVYAPPCAAMADAAASDRVLHPESAGTRAEAHRAAKEDGRVAAGRHARRTVEVSLLSWFVG